MSKPPTKPESSNSMSEQQSTMAQQVAQVVMAFQEKTTGHAPKAVTVVLSKDTLVVTLHEALSPAEKDLARTASGAAKVQEFHRQLFSTASQSLRDEIHKITGVQMREAIAEVEPSTGAVVCAFASGTVVQVYQLARGVAASIWNAKPSSDRKKSPRPARNEPKKRGAK